MASGEWLEVLLPRTCSGCDHPGTLWCPRCSAQLALAHAHLEPPGITTLPVLAGGGAHSGALRAAIVAHKGAVTGRVRSDLIRLFAEALSILAAISVGADHLTILSVPPSRRRGRDPLQSLLSPLARSSRRAAWRTLRPVGRRHSQKGLSATARKSNMHGRLRAPPPGTHGALAVVADDVSTTGASLAEAARAARASGWHVLGGIVLSRTPTL